MNVEKAGFADIGALVELRLAYLREDNGRLDESDERAIAKGLPDYFRAHIGKDLFVYVIREGQTVTSCAFLLVVEKPMSPAFINGKTGLVLNVYTRPGSRRRGRARAVMAALLRDGGAMGLSVVELKATEDGRPLYLSVGFSDDRSKYHPMKIRFDQV